MLALSNTDKKKIERIIRQLRKEYPEGTDPWGLNLDLAEKALKLLTPLYRNYFQVRLIGAEKILNKPYVIVANHSGQIPIDAILISIAFLLDVESPHLIRPMVEKFMATLPFINKYASALGAVLGDRQNAHYLLERGQSLLVFPEGVKGITKNSTDFYNVQEFSHGFYRMAASHQTSILPLAVIGAEEMYPFVLHASTVGRWMGLPSLPLSLNLLPLPSPIDIYVGEEFNPSDKESEKTIQNNVFLIEQNIKKLVVQGLAKRRPFFDFIRRPISQYIKEFRKKKS